MVDVTGIVFYERDFPVEIKHPIKGDPVGLTVFVKHLGCQAAVEVRDQMRAQGKSGKLDGDDIFVACISRWEGDICLGPDADPLPNTDEAKRKWLTHPHTQWMVDQVVQGMGDITNFTDA